MILPADALGYDDLTEFGRVTIERGAGGIVIMVDGFEFTEAQSCRTHTAKAMAWARDVLATAVVAQQLVPGGGIMTCRGVDLEELEAERSAHSQQDTAARRPNPADGAPKPPGHNPIR